MRLKVMFSSFLALMFTPVENASASRALAVPISLSYINCANNAPGISEPRVVVTNGAQVVIARKWPAAARTLIRPIKLTLPPGFYGIGISDGGCFGDVRVTVLAAHPRSLVIVGTNQTLLVAPTAILSGTLPSRGWQVAVVYPDRRPINGFGTDSSGDLEVSATVEQDAYYVTGLPEGRIFVRLYNQAHDKWFDFDAGRVDLRLRGGRSALIRNITPEELRAAIDAVGDGRRHNPPQKY
jgi:hypothetical protein